MMNILGQQIDETNVQISINNKECKVVEIKELPAQKGTVFWDEEGNRDETKGTFYAEIKYLDSAQSTLHCNAYLTFQIEEEEIRMWGWAC